MLFLILTITVPSTVWWYLVRTDKIEHYWALLWWGVSVVVLAGVLGKVDWTLWRAEGHDGYVNDIIDRYSAAFGLGGFLFAIGLGIAAAEVARAVNEGSARRPAVAEPVVDPAAIREYALQAEARRAVAGSEEMTRKLEELLAWRNELLRRGQVPEPTTAPELVARASAP